MTLRSLRFSAFSFLIALTCSAAERPNVLFIAVDDLRPAIGCYGDPLAVTPHLDQLAREGMLFERAYCQVAVCNPSRASLMTGLRPDRLGVWTLPIHFREAMPDAVTIPQWFRRSGYTAVSHGKIYHNPTPDPQSWSEPIRDLPPLPFPYPEGTSERIEQAAAKLPARDWRKKSLRPPSTAAPELEDSQVLDGARTEMAIEDLLRLSQESAPFFLAMGYIRPHLAWVAPKRYWDLHDPAKLPVLTDEQLRPNTPSYAMHNNSELSHYMDLIDFPAPWEPDTIAEAKARQLVHGYYACVSFVDAQIGRLLKALEDTGLRENTIVVLWSDHGWKLGEHRGWGKMTNYEVDARVPLIISAPGMKTAGQKSDSLVELLDLYPTLCELAGIEVPEFVDGVSLVPTLEDPTESVHQVAVNQYYRRTAEGEFMGYSARSETHRLIEWRDFETGEAKAYELYEHVEEHSEGENIIATAPTEIVEELTAALLQNHPRRGLSLLPAIHSDAAQGRWATPISFLNHSASPIRIFPISSIGRRAGGRRLEPGAEVTIPARIGGVFVVESEDGQIYEIHSPSVPSRPVILK